jgi:hypothetical protein
MAQLDHDGVLSRLPPDLLRDADLTGSRELLWPGAAAMRVIDWVAAQQLGIVVVEAYGPRGQARGQFLGEWQTTGWSEDESWAEFVRRSAREAGAAVRGADTGAERFFIAIATADDVHQV